jgi:hypothetical protein
MTYDDALFTTLRKRFDSAVTSEQREREKMLEDLRFRTGDQWPDDIRQARSKDNRPCLTINRLPGMIHQVSNEVRQNRPSPSVSPVDDAGDIDTAEVYAGLIRHVERLSHAPAVRSYAAEYAISVGRGFYRVVTDYASPTSFDQEIFIRRIKNPFAVYYDPSCQEPDYSDGDWAFVIENYSLEAYKRHWPDSDVSSGAFTSIGDREPIWVSDNGVQVAEYFHREYRERVLAALPATPDLMEPLESIIQAVEGDRINVFADELPDEYREYVVAERPDQIPTVHWCKTNGYEKLEDTIWPGRWIPIIPILGEELDVDGETRLAGMVRDAKDSQRMYNYWATAATEIIALAPRAPFIAEEGQLEGHEKEWQQANVRNFPVLKYKAKTLGDHLAPPPQRQGYEPPVMAITQARIQAADDLHATTNVYPPQLGAQSNETSGRAIQARDIQGDTANFHLIDAVSIAIHHETRILVDLIPKIYDRPGRVARIIGEDGDEKTVTLNMRHQEKGVERIYDLGAGTYDVAVEVGPSYTTKRQQAVDSILKFIEVYPAAAPVIGDRLAKNMDWPGAREIAERLKKMLPAELQDQDGTPIPPQAQAQIAQLNQMVEQLTQALNEATRKIETKQVELESKERIEREKLESRERIESQGIRTEILKVLAETGSREAIELLKVEQAAITARQDLLNVDEPVIEEAA